jgi:hypothetical protein
MYFVNIWNNSGIENNGSGKRYFLNGRRSKIESPSDH